MSPAFSTWYSDGSRRNKITLLPWYSALIYSKMICLFDIVKVMENMAHVTSCPLNVNCWKKYFFAIQRSILKYLYRCVFFPLFCLSSLIISFHVNEKILESGTFSNEEYYLLRKSCSNAFNLSYQFDWSRFVCFFSIKCNICEMQNHF